jgi:serine/threonine protein kinase
LPFLGKSVLTPYLSAYGVVYKARHREANVILAIKIVEIDNAAARKEVQDEIDILKKCRHNHIVNYYGAIAKDKHLWVRRTIIAYDREKIRLTPVIFHETDFDGLLRVRIDERSHYNVKYITSRGANITRAIPVITWPRLSSRETNSSPRHQSRKYSDEFQRRGQNCRFWCCHDDGGCHGENRHPCRHALLDVTCKSI